MGGTTINRAYCCVFDSNVGSPLSDPSVVGSAATTSAGALPSTAPAPAPAPAPQTAAQQLGFTTYTPDQLTNLLDQYNANGGAGSMGNLGAQLVPVYDTSTNPEVMFGNAKPSIIGYQTPGQDVQYDVNGNVTSGNIGGYEYTFDNSGNVTSKTKVSSSPWAALTPIADIAAMATGNPELIPLINGASTVAQGGNLGKALTNAALSYVTAGAGDVLGGALSDAGITSPIAQSAITNAATQLATTGKIDPVSIATGAALSTGENAALDAAGVTDPTVSGLLKNATNQLVNTGSINPISLVNSTISSGVKQNANNTSPTPTDMTGFQTDANNSNVYGTGSTNQSPIDNDLPVTGMVGADNTDAFTSQLPSGSVLSQDQQNATGPLVTSTVTNPDGSTTYKWSNNTWATYDANGNMLADVNNPNGVQPTNTSGGLTDNTQPTGGLENVPVNDNKDTSGTYDYSGGLPVTPQPTGNKEVTPGLETVTVVGDKPTDTTIQPTPPEDQPITPVDLTKTIDTGSGGSGGASNQASTSSDLSGLESGLTALQQAQQQAKAQAMMPKFNNDVSVLTSKNTPSNFQKEAALHQLYDTLDPELAKAMGVERPAVSTSSEEDTQAAHGGSIHNFDNGGSFLLDETDNSPGQNLSGILNTLSTNLQPKFASTPSAVLQSTDKYAQQMKLHPMRHLYQSINPDLRAHLMGGGPVVGLGGMAEGGLPARYHPEAPEGHHPEFITGQTGYYAAGRGTGQSDDIPAMLNNGDYVLDADTVAQLGDGSSKAGAQALEHFRNQVPHHAHGGLTEPVPAKIADGEYVLPASFVTALGGGDNKTGSKLLDKMREELREHKRSAAINKIPPKAKSPLDYLRMAKHG